MLRIAGDADCQKVNCPEGAREATLGCVASLLAMTYIIQLDPSIDGAYPDTPGGVSLHFFMQKSARHQTGGFP